MFVLLGITFYGNDGGRWCAMTVSVVGSSDDFYADACEWYVRNVYIFRLLLG